MDFDIGKRSFNRNFSKRTAINMTAIFMICNLITNQSVMTLPKLKTLQIQYSRHFQKNDGPVLKKRLLITGPSFFWKCLEYCICNVLSLGSVVTD